MLSEALRFWGWSLGFCDSGLLSESYGCVEPFAALASTRRRIGVFPPKAWNPDQLSRGLDNYQYYSGAPYDTYIVQHLPKPLFF